MSNFHFGKGSLSKLEGVKPITKELCEYALSISTVDFSVIDGLRTLEQQQAMYNNGKSELDGVNKVSDHQLGLAIDVVPYIKIDGAHLNPFEVDNPIVRNGYLEMYRAFMRAGFKLGVCLEFGFAYNIGGGRDWPHISLKGKKPAMNNLLK